MKQRSTRQLAATYQALASAAHHPTAEQVFLQVRRTLPRVSLGTVYRNLEKLREQGRLRVLWLGGGVAHYDAMVEDHDHFVCERCQTVHDIEGGGRGRPQRGLAGGGFVVLRRTATLFGLCPGCAEDSGGRPARVRGKARSE